MKVLVKATHNILPAVNKEIDVENLSEVVGALIHFGYNVDNETLATEEEIIANGKNFT